MSEFRCVKCGSDNIQIVRGIFESGTEAEYKEKNDFTKNPTISELLTENKNVVIKSQTRLAERLGEIYVKEPRDTELNDFINLEIYGAKRNKKSELDTKIKTLEEELENIEKLKEKVKKQQEIIPAPLLALFYILLFFGLLYYVTSLGENIGGLLGVIVFIILLIVGSFLIAFFMALYIDSERKKRKKTNDEKKLEKIKAEGREKKINDEIDRLKIEIENIDEEIAEIEKEAKIKQDKFKRTSREEIKRQNKEKEKIWSNLFYCHRCDTVMDLDHGVYDQPENINNLVDKIYKDVSDL
ncbi:AAA family ATPase [Euhalothece natronophila]|uniref:hypothetical protein n=1 Tax=Euhalothece natronophila TaxID=577489 RepID=UPI001646ECBF|nr:hypothetical protein [Euhalothece natronophila]